MSISVVVPVFNSAGNLALLCDRLEGVLGLLRPSGDYEIVLVEDGSKDNSWAVIDGIAESHANVVGIRLARNYGQHNALLCGIRQARYEVVVTLDDDLQNPPEEIPRLLAELEKGADVVYGTPEVQQHGFLRNIASVLTKWVLSRGMASDTARGVSAFRVFRRSIVDSFDDYKNEYVSIDGLLTWGTDQFVTVPVRHDARSFGESGYSLRKLLRHASNMVTSFSTGPLRFASLAGLLFSLLGFVALLFVGGRYLLSGVAVPGFTFIACAVTVFSGVQLLCIGIIGEYLARVHTATMGRPSYAEKAVVRGAEGTRRAASIG
jgi:glycosyltransferase involved in cell wall biosynthesis